MNKNKILIIEDNPVNFRYIVDILEANNVSAIISMTGKSGFDKAVEILPDLILLDIGLPDISGIEVCKLLKSNSIVKNIPVIFLTAFNSKESIIEGFKAGAIDYITKPFSTGELLARINSQLNIINLQNELIKSQKKYKAYIENTPTSVIVIDNEGNILGANPACCNFFKYTIEEIKNINIKNILHTDSIIVYEDKIIELIQKPNISGKFQIVTKQNEDKWISIDCYKTDDEKIVIFSQDITDIILNEKLINSYAEKLAEEVKERTNNLNDKIEELKRMEIKLKKLLKNEKEINKLKSNIVSTVSHDFRTPLSVIQSSVELIQNFNSQLEESKRQNLFEKIYNTIDSLLNLLNNMLLINKLENERTIVHKEKFDLKSEIQKNVEELELINSKKLKVKTVYTGNNIVNSDKVIIVQILINLLTNALKYSENDCIFKTIVDKNKIKFFIRDFGIGISDEEKKNIFKIFYRASNSDNYKGTGVGLYIVSKYIRLLEGKIRIKTKIGKGTIFFVEIPI
jgi:PAS domain S-box-containing protein